MTNHFELNGSKGWVISFMFVIVVQCVAVGFWAGSLSNDIKNIKQDLVEVKEDVKELNQKEG